MENEDLMKVVTEKATCGWAKVTMTLRKLK